MCIIPIIAFDSGFNTDWHTLKKDFGQVLLLAGPGIVVIAILVALIFKYPLGYNELSWSEVLLIGAILSATDPVAVIAMLKEVGASKKISVIIDGESLLNDGTAMVFFHVMSTVVLSGEFDVGNIVGLFFRLTLGAWTLGFMFAVVVYFCFRRLTSDGVEAAALTLFSAYLLFLLPEGTEVEMSGILAICSMGYFLSGFSGAVISPLVEEPLHHVWNFLSWMAETELFVLAGVIIGGEVLRTGEISGRDWGMLPVHFVLLYLTRVVMIGMFYPILKYSGYSINWRNFVIFVHAGLRGGVALTLALTVFADPSYSFPLRNICIFQVAGMAVMTVVINGCTGKLLMQVLGLTENSGEQELVLNDAVKSVIHEGVLVSDKLRRNVNLEQADWTRVQDLAGTEKIAAEVISRLTAGQSVVKKMKKEGRSVDMVMDEYEDVLTSVQKNNRLAEARKRLLLVIKARYGYYRQRALCLPSTFVYLQHQSDIANDFTQEKFCTWDVIEKSLFQSLQFRALLWFRNVPGFKRLVRRLVYNKIGMTYDCCLAFISAHEEAWRKFSSVLPGLLSQVSEDLKTEVDAQIAGCRDFMRKHLLIAYPHIVQVFQERTASILVINQLKSSVDDYCGSGILTADEAGIVSQSVDQRLWSMFYVNPLKGVPGFKEQVSQWPMFKDVPTELINLLTAISVPVLLTKDELLYAERSEVRAVYIVVHGRVIEKNEKDLLLDHEPGSIVGAQYIFVDPPISQTEARADILVYAQRIDLSVLRRALSGYQKDLWKTACPALIMFSQGPDKPRLNSRALMRMVSSTRISVTTSGEVINLSDDCHAIIPRIPDVERIETPEASMDNPTTARNALLSEEEKDEQQPAPLSPTSVIQLPDLYDRWLRNEKDMAQALRTHQDAEKTEELPQASLPIRKRSEDSEDSIPLDP